MYEMAPLMLKGAGPSGLSSRVRFLISVLRTDRSSSCNWLFIESLSFSSMGFGRQDVNKGNYSV